MTKTQTIIQEINKLSLNELELVLQAILKRVDRKKHVELLLDKLIGKGEGVWDFDAQGHVNDLRDNDRM